MLHASLDTSKDFVLAISKDGQIIHESRQIGTGRDSDRLLADWLIDAFAQCGLTVNDAEAWSVGIGPGSFAGLRCGIAMVKAFCLSSGAKYRGVPSVYALARQAQEATPEAKMIGVLNDGRCGQVILSRYAMNEGTLTPAGESVPLFPEELLKEENACDAYITNQDSIPPLPEVAAKALIRTTCVDPKFLLDDIPYIPWPTNAIEREKSTAPLYVRQAVFVAPAPIREIRG